ncbi:MAG TPA: hypothetical protein VMD91_09780 [Candidatus Sulfotelmatobacter sp.]|nr:hypothetical protein [Candidatus Sulfotelmatobacter sp.]
MTETPADVGRQGDERHPGWSLRHALRVESRRLTLIAVATIVIAVGLVVAFSWVLPTLEVRRPVVSVKDYVLTHGKDYLRFKLIVQHPRSLRVNDSALLTIALAAKDGDIRNAISHLHAPDTANPRDVRALVAQVVHAEEDAHATVLWQNVSVLPIPPSGPPPGVTIEKLAVTNAHALGIVNIPPDYHAIRVWQYLITSDRAGVRSLVEDWHFLGQETTSVQHITFTQPWISPENVPTVLAVITGIVGLATTVYAARRPL